MPESLHTEDPRPSIGHAFRRCDMEGVSGGPRAVLASLEARALTLIKGSKVC